MWNESALENYSRRSKTVKKRWASSTDRSVRTLLRQPLNHPTQELNLELHPHLSRFHYSCSSSAISGRQRRALCGMRPPWLFRLAAGIVQHADWRLLQAAHTMLSLLVEVRAGIISSTQFRAFLLQDLVDTWLPLRPPSSVSRYVRVFVFGLFLIRALVVPRLHV